MMGSPMVLIFLLPLIAFSYLVTGVGDLLGIDVEAVFDSFTAWLDNPEVENTLVTIGETIESFIIEIGMLLK